MTNSGYACLKAGLNRISVSLRNLTGRTVTLKPKTVVAKLAASNVIPLKLAPKPEENSEDTDQEKIKRKPLFEDRMKELFSKLDLSEIENWEEAEKEEVRALIREYSFHFALGDLDLGKASIVKHKIKLTDNVPFKERYMRIIPHQFEEVRKHFQEMLDIGAISKSNSPWASAVVLVRKKDGSLRFCIDLRKLNARMVKDSYSLPRIDESLDSLNRAVLFTSLDLKSGYWQVEIDEESKQYAAFTVGPLGFYQCNRIPFGLTNAPATFQRLIKTCLGDLYLNLHLRHQKNIWKD